MNTDVTEVNINGKTYAPKGTIPLAYPVGGDKSNPFMVLGLSYFIRTVTHYFTGRLVWVGEKEIALEDVAWIADTGRFNQFAKGETVNEVEPFPKGVVIIGRSSIVDMSEHGLLLSVK